MNVFVPPNQRLSGQVELPGDKSISHRAALFAALAKGESHIKHFLDAGVTRAMLNALTLLGVEWSLDKDTLTVMGGGLQGLCPPTTALNCGNSATTLRLLAGAIAAAGIPATLDGSPGLRQRPMARLVRPLYSVGVPITASPALTAPLTLAKRTHPEMLRPTRHVLPVASAQVKSALLLAALAADGSTSIQEPTPSRDHTERMLQLMGSSLSVTPDALEVTLNPTIDMPLNPISIHIPGDFSSASFLIVSALITPNSDIQLIDIGLNPTRTGLLDALREMGASVEVSVPELTSGEPRGSIHVRTSELYGIEIKGDQAVRMIDEFPVFAVAAAFADGITRVRDAQELRHKESDRIGTLCSLLATIGVDIREHPDGFEIRGGKRPQGAIVNAHGDHRIALAMAVLGLGSARGVTVLNAEIFEESFPKFFDLLKSIGGESRYE